MKTLIVEDDFTCRLLLQKMLEKYGDCHIAVNGREATVAVRSAVSSRRPYDLICLDIMMPEMDGQETLKALRAIERQAGIAGLDCVKVIMTTALADTDNILQAFREQCDGYLTKPIRQEKLLALLAKLSLIAA